MRLLAIDPATRKVGWAAGDTAARPSYAVRTFPQTGRDLGRLSRMYGDWLVHMIREYDIECVVSEEPILYVSRKKTQAIVHYKLVGLGFKTADVCSALGVGFKQYDARTLKLHFTGDGSAPKEEMVNAAQQLGFTGCRDDNEADALACFSKWVHDFDPEHARAWDRIGGGL